MTIASSSILGQITESIDKSTRRAVREPVSMLVAILCDIGFFFAYGFLSAPLIEALIEQSVLVAGGIGQLLRAQQFGSFFELLFDSSVRNHSLALLGIMAALGGLAYVLYVVFEGTSWYSVWSIVHQGKGSWTSYVKSFAKVNLVWFSIYYVYFGITTILDVRGAVISSLTKEAASTSVQGLLLGLVLVCLSAALPSYVCGSVRSAIKVVQSHPLEFILAWGVILVVLFASQFVIDLFARLDPAIGILSGILLLPVISLLKLFAVTYLEDRHVL